jgi:hypothetical protein
VELPEHTHQLLRLDRVDKARPAAQVGEEHRDLPAVALQNWVVARAHERISELRREEAAEPLQPLELLELRPHAFFERSVQLEQLYGLRLDRVVVALDPKQRPHAREQLVLVERLRNEVVGAGLDRLRLLRPLARREHDHGQHGRLLALAKPPADRVAVHVRHHDVEKH